MSGRYGGPGSRPRSPPRYESFYLGDQNSEDTFDPLPPFDPRNTQGLSWDGYSSDSGVDSRSYDSPPGFGRYDSRVLYDRSSRPRQSRYRTPRGSGSHEIQEMSRTQPMASEFRLAYAPTERMTSSPRRWSEEWAVPPFRLPVTPDSRFTSSSTAYHSPTMLPFRDYFLPYRDCDAGPSRRPDYSAGSSIRGARLRDTESSLGSGVRGSLAQRSVPQVHVSSGRREPSVRLRSRSSARSSQDRRAGWGNRAHDPLNLMGPGAVGAGAALSSSMPPDMPEGTATSGGWGWGFLGGVEEQNRYYVGERDTATSRWMSEQELAQRELDDQMGRLEVGRSQYPTYLPRQEYRINRWAGEPVYRERQRSPRRRRSGWDWETERSAAPAFSEETTHYSEERGSVVGEPLGGYRRNRAHPHFPTIVQDQEYGVGGRRWVNPNPAGMQAPIVEDVTDDNLAMIEQLDTFAMLDPPLD